MRVAEAEKAIVHEWRSWRLRHGKPESWANADDSLNFWGYLCDDRPDLLKFRCKG